ncbi:MAG: cbb3-type cytochrome oxidase assembly protein CcoS [Betaproteobacteria bacterium]|jgi:cbb3-type cytochrome oxidase maturation protein|nr:cbb3-type cytochrome oxidase assembly protein CcoS [Betaproteobacteria bacterium]
MEILYLLIPLSVVLVFLIGMVFWWSVNNGQFDDLEGPGYRVLMDDDLPRPERAADDDSGVDAEEITVDSGAGKAPRPNHYEPLK